MRRRAALFALALVLLFVACACAPADADRLAVHYFYLGGNEAILATFKGECALIDAGSEITYLELQAQLHALGHRAIDTLILTHPHDDHCGGAQKVLRFFSPRQVILSDMGDNSVWKDVTDVAAECGVSIVYAKQKDTFPLADAYFEVVGPVESGYSDVNDYSLVLRLAYQSRAFLLPADATATAEFDMLREKVNLKADVLKIAHHGSDTSTTPEFLAAVDPEICILNVKTPNAIGHPAIEVLKAIDDRGAALYCTQDHGIITVSTNGTDLVISTEK